MPSGADPVEACPFVSPQLQSHHLQQMRSQQTGTGPDRSFAARSWQVAQEGLAPRLKPPSTLPRAQNLVNKATSTSGLQTSSDENTVDCWDGS